MDHNNMGVWQTEHATICAWKQDYPYYFAAKMVLFKAVKTKELLLWKQRSRNGYQTPRNGFQIAMLILNKFEILKFSEGHIVP